MLASFCNYTSSPLPPEPLREYLLLTKTRGWRKAFYELQKSAPENAGELFLNMASIRRVGWRFLLPAGSSATRVLCLGWGWTSVPIAFAQSCGQVIIVERTKECLESIRAFARSAGITNILYVNSEGSCQLPLQDNCFDIAVINGMPELLGDKTRGSDRLGQSSFIYEILRVLGKKGVIYLELSNTLSYRHAVDSLRGGSVQVFRLISTAWSRLLGIRSHGTFSGSLSHWTRLVAGAGIGSVRSYSLLPHPSDPRQIVDLDPAGQIRAVQPGGSVWKARLKSNVSFLRAFSPSFSLIMSREENADPGFVDELIPVLEGRIGVNGIKCKRYSVQFWGANLFCSAGDEERQKFVVRLPFGQSEAMGVRANAKSLTMLKAARWWSGESQVSFPELIYQGTLNTQYLSVETWLPGVDLRRLSKQVNAEVMRFELCQFLIDFAKATRSDTERMNADFGNQMAAMRENIKGALLDEESGEQFECLVGCVLNYLERIRLPVVWGHGDFNLGNCLWSCEESRLSGVIDWDHMVIGLAGWDLLNLFTSLRRRKGMAWGNAVLQLIEGPWEKYEVELWGLYAKALGLSAMHSKALIWSLWVRNVWWTLTFDPLRGLNYEWLSANVYPVLRAFKVQALDRKIFS